jgi:hypothetical protein
MGQFHKGLASIAIRMDSAWRGHASEGNCLKQRYGGIRLELLTFDESDGRVTHQKKQRRGSVGVSVGVWLAFRAS